MSSHSQFIYEVFEHQKVELLIHLLKTVEGLDSVLVCAKTREGVHALTAAVNHADIPAESIHGNKKPELRDRALKAFQEGKFRALITTDASARDIDCPGVTNVIHFDWPELMADYSNRAQHVEDTGGVLISLVAPKDNGLLEKLEKLNGETFPRKVADEFRYDTQPVRAKAPRKKGGESKGPRSKPLQNKKPKLKNKFGR